MTTPEARVCCAVCGSINVQYAVWYSPNTSEAGECFGSWNAGDNTFCEDCDQEGREPNADLLDIDADGAAFNKARKKREKYLARQTVTEATAKEGA